MTFDMTYVTVTLLFPCYIFKYKYSICIVYHKVFTHVHGLTFCSGILLLQSIAIVHLQVKVLLPDIRLHLV